MGYIKFFHDDDNYNNDNNDDHLEITIAQLFLQNRQVKIHTYYLGKGVVHVAVGDTVAAGVPVLGGLAAFATPPFYR